MEFERIFLFERTERISLKIQIKNISIINTDGLVIFGPMHFRCQLEQIA